jgi:UDP-N-acetylmuramyl pentapeptide phosphotransferase/UDP-N-acetylglucosamine-1-phosphate transferase
MKSLVADGVLGIFFVAPLAAVLIALQFLQAVPDNPRAHLVARRVLGGVAVVLVVAFAVFVLLRFHYLR